MTPGAQTPRILGVHPEAPSPLAEVLAATDAATASQVEHRDLSERDGTRDRLIAVVREMIERHHASPEGRAQEESRLQAMRTLGLEDGQSRLGLFPRTETTRKGNLAEVVLAEYLKAAGSGEVLVYRLRCNPNVDQAMKGDDVLVFDLDSNPVRVVVGEAKFRDPPARRDVEAIVSGLGRSKVGGAPTSLTFVAAMLGNAGSLELARRVADCTRLLALQQLRLDYVGLLAGDSRCCTKVRDCTPGTLPQLAMISLCVDAPSDFVRACFEGLD